MHPGEVAAACSPASTSPARRSGSSIRASAITVTARRRRPRASRAPWSPSTAGHAAALLTAERTALNFLQRLSGIATLTRAVRRRRRRPHHRPRHAQDHAAAAGAREVRRARRRRQQSSHRPRRRHPDQGQPRPAGGRRRGGGDAHAQRPTARCRPRSRRRASSRWTRRCAPAPTSSCSTTCRRPTSSKPCARCRGPGEDRDLRRRDARRGCRSSPRPAPTSCRSAR